MIRLILVLVLIGSMVPPAAALAHDAGVASVDITPDYPIRLSGFAHRKTESEGVDARLFAKALAFRDAAHGPAVLLAVDSLGVPDYMTRDVAARLQARAKLDPIRLAITSTHTHSAPILTGCCPNIAGEPIPPAQQEKIDRYTRELADKLEQVALAALADLKPARIEYGIGTHALAKNRRRAGGPVDHDLPVMAVRDPAGGKLRAVYVSYACHCVTLSHMKISGDWAGFAAAAIERDHPGAIALTSIGCGADANPASGVAGDKLAIAREQGDQLAAATDAVLRGPLALLDQPLATQVNRIALPFDKHPSRDQFEQWAKQTDYQGYFARVQLAKLDRGERLPAEQSYAIQTWNFGDQLAMLFLPGEVVVDYSIRLKKDFDRARLWINAYSNDVPSYIPSERILREGGYEADSSMWFYDRPTRYAAGIEQRIIDEVHRQMPATFAAPKGTEGVAPRTPQQSLRAMRTKDDLEIELVAAEPLVQSPVAIDWSADGRLFVCEMYDYPTGADGNWTPGGRVKLLSDTNGDGTLDHAAVFLDKIPFPTGVTAYGDGVLVCAAPDILHARDTDGDGRADKVQKLFTGFATDNYQARVNSITLGLDNWLYAGNGLLGGTITSGQAAGFSPRHPHPVAPLDIRNRDFRFRFPNDAIETVTGLTQFGRVRDDWGNWFGCDNSNALLAYPHEERYLRRNPHVAAPPPVVRPPADYDASRVFPISRTLERFNDPGNANRFTSASGLAIYRDDLLGATYAGNAFTAEPVHNLVHRMVLSGEGAGVTRARAADDRESEFLASADNWFRPVQVRTGPDGALYVVDMYRFLIEHPRWIAPERLAQLDVRAGSDMGRIYRVRRKGTPLRNVRDLTKLAGAELAAALDAPNGIERDRVHLELNRRTDRTAAAPLERLAREARLPQVRVQALCALDGMAALPPQLLRSALEDADARVRLHAARLFERLEPGGRTPILALVDDPSPLVRRQLARTLGEWDDPRAGKALAQLAVGAADDAEMRIAVLSSASRYCGPLLDAIMKLPPAAREAWVGPLVATAAASGDGALVRRALTAVVPAEGEAPGPSQFAALAGLLEVLDRSGVALAEHLPAAKVQQVFAAARRVVGDEAAAEAVREAAVGVMGRGDVTADDLELLVRLVTRGSSDALRAAAVETLRRQQSQDVAARLLADWPQAPLAARAQVVDLLVGRDTWTIALLDAVKAKRIAASEISLTDRQRIAESPSDDVRKLAAATFPPPASAPRAEVLSRYDAVASLAGDAARGAELFSRNCAACHAAAGIGHDVGPSLAALRDKEPAYFVKNILDPNAVVEPRFVNYTVQLKDNRWVSGVIRAETSASLTLVTGSGMTETIARGDVRDVRPSNTSMMPEGFETAMSPQQLADVIAFLKSPGQRKQVAGNAPATVNQAKDGSLVLPATAAEIFGGSIVLEVEYRNIGYWHDAGDHVAWTVEVGKPAEFEVHLDYACAADSAGNTYALDAGGGQTISGIVEATGADWTTYKQVRVGKLKLGAGRHRLTVRSVGPLRGALIDLRTIALTPAGAAPKWPVMAVGAAAQATARAAPPGELARTPAAVARVILDANRSTAAREAAVNANPQFAADLIAEMTRDLPAAGADAKLEYERIPWIWRVAIAAGKRDDAAMIRRVLDVSLPRGDAEPLRDWQAVVIGGGIINGISMRGAWPGDRVMEIVGHDAALRARWERALSLSSAMADDEKVPAGTRYDALRMLGIEPFERRGAQLVRYLSKGTNAELQMGAVSGLGDMNSPAAARALEAALPDLTEANRQLAVGALKRERSPR